MGARGGRWWEPEARLPRATWPGSLSEGEPALRLDGALGGHASGPEQPAAGLIWLLASERGDEIYKD